MALIVCFIVKLCIAKSKYIINSVLSQLQKKKLQLKWSVQKFLEIKESFEIYF